MRCYSHDTAHVDAAANAADVPQAGQHVWKTRDAALESRLKATYDGLSQAAARKLPVAAAVIGAIGTPLRVLLRDDDGNEVCEQWAALASELVVAQLDVIGMAFMLGQLDMMTLPSQYSLALGIKVLDFGSGCRPLAHPRCRWHWRPRTR
jgi:hypothetical protein